MPDSRKLGSVDVLVHNVGGSGQYDGGAAALTDEDWQSALNANLLAAVRLDREIIPGLVTRGSGAIVHVTSIQRRAPPPTSNPVRGGEGRVDQLQQGAIE